ncbi:MAG TPA: hypothetical protein VHW90_08345 [Stellaceae bacterium]|nr:hypothetical protein [Stellaceae bacterium]
MRIPLILAVLATTAACSVAAPDDTAPPPAGPVATAPASPTSEPIFGFPHLFASGPTRLTLSNFSYDSARVQAVVTTASDCTPVPGSAPGDFVLPINGTHVLDVAPGTDVCWRRELAPGTPQSPTSASSGWTPWNRAYLSSGHSIDAQL